MKTVDNIDKYLTERRGIDYKDDTDRSEYKDAELQGTFNGIIATVEDIKSMIEYNNIKMAKKSYKWLKKRLKDIEQFL